MPPVDHLESAASGGDVEAIAKLEEFVDCPEEIEYLVEWAYQLFGRSGGAGMGVAPLNPIVAESWARQMGYGELHPLELEALMDLTDALLQTDEEPATENPPILTNEELPVVRSRRRQWPQQKA